MNCRPHQRAWICVPRIPTTQRLGLDALHGHVVETKYVHHESPADDPCWVVDPPQWAQARGPFPEGFPLKAGERLECVSVPDSWLRPFEDFPPEQLQDERHEVSA